MENKQIMNQTNKSANKKKILWQQYIGMAFFMLIGALCGFFMMMYVDRYGGEKTLYETILTLIGLFLGMYAAIYFHLIIHEAGHLVFGLLSGYQFSSFRIFSLMWVKENGKIRLKRLHITGTGGQCLMTPPDMVNGKIPIVLYNLGGSLMNLIAGVVFLGLFFAFGKIPFLSALMLLFSVIGFVIAIMNGVPMRMGTVDNDGYNAFALTRNTEAMRSFWLQLKINDQIAKGVRLKDMPDAWFVVPTDEAMKNSMVVVAGVFTANRLMDAKQFEEADQLMAHMLEIDSGMVGLHRNLMICDRMYLELIGENRREVVDGMRDKTLIQFMKSMKTFPSILRTEYVYALLYEKDAEKAEKIRLQFEKSAKTCPYQNDIQSERELMELAAERKPL